MRIWQIAAISRHGGNMQSGAQHHTPRWTESPAAIPALRGPTRENAVHDGSMPGVPSGECRWALWSSDSPCDDLDLVQQTPLVDNSSLSVSLLHTSSSLLCSVYDQRQREQRRHQLPR